MKKIIKLLEIFITVIFLQLIYISNLKSQEIEPRFYANIPKGFNALALAYTYSNGDIVTEGTSPIQDLKISSNTPVLGYVRTFSLFKCLSRIQVNIPYTFLSGNAQLRGKDTSATRSGFSDARVRFGINFYGSPALSPAEFVKYKQGRIIGSSLVISVPIGQYYPEKLINLGSNRWGFKPEVGISNNFNRFFVEAYAGVWLYTKNNEYLKTNTLSQNPLLSFQFHVSYLFPNFMWVAINSNYSNGGQTSLNGKSNNDYQNNVRIGVTYSTPITKNLSAKLQYHSAAETRSGGNYKIFALTLQYTWF
ncbi:MAG TPA: transporter [Ignavibacteria bacterium]|nr:transporter [Ignavibacteria bacterium]